jgi:hypothetical protein
LLTATQQLLIERNGKVATTTPPLFLRTDGNSRSDPTATGTASTVLKNGLASGQKNRLLSMFGFK